MTQGASESTGGPRVHRLFGLAMASAFPFASRLGAGTGPADLTFTCGLEPPAAAVSSSGLGPPVYASPERTPAGESIAYLFRGAGGDLLRFTGVGDFHLGADRIDCHLRDRRWGFVVELRLLGPVLAYWLERAGLPALHASAVAVGGRAVAFLAGREAGKSVLAAAFLTAGHPLLSDDVVAVEEAPDGSFRGRPGYPQMRLWPAEAERFAGRPDLPRVHPDYAKRRVPVGPGGFGAFVDAAHRLGALYLPERFEGAGGGEQVRFVPVSPRDAVIELTRRSFIPRLAAAAGWQAGRLATFARLAERVPVRRLLYPAGFERLAEVRAAVLADLA